MSNSIGKKISYPGKHVEVLGSKIHYIDVGVGDPILFLHGIPTSSYLWRNIIPYLDSLGRCIAPDLIGLGWSDKPDISYTVFEHIKFIEKFIEILNLQRITLILHGWGSVIGFDYAMRNEHNCNGLVFYESFLRSLDDLHLSLPFQEQLIGLKNLENDVLMSDPLIADKLIMQNAMRELTNEEMHYYHQPFEQIGSNRPIIQYLSELLNDDEKNKINTIIVNYTAKLIKSKLPKLMLYSIPGFITTIATVMWAKENITNIEIVDVGEALHLAQEINPELIGNTISVWLQGLDLTKGAA